jgi:peptide/nickel transport system substrate-binding protein
MQVVFQDPYSSLSPRRTIEQIVSEGLELHHPELDRMQRRARVVETLADPSLPVFIMREKDAQTDPFEQVKEPIGSGPFVFRKDLWRPGVKSVYDRNKDYKPRNEPLDGMAGGKVVKLDRVEWISMPDVNTAANALAAGEVDLIESLAFDVMPQLKNDPQVIMRSQPVRWVFAYLITWLLPLVTLWKHTVLNV